MRRDVTASPRSRPMKRSGSGPLGQVVQVGVRRGLCHVHQTHETVTEMPRWPDRPRRATYRQSAISVGLTLGRARSDLPTLPTPAGCERTSQRDRHLFGSHVLATGPGGESGVQHWCVRPSATRVRPHETRVRPIRPTSDP